MSHIDTSLLRARTQGREGLSDAALTDFSIAGHTLSDLGSPTHVSADGTPTVWGLGPTHWLSDIGHVWGERDEAVDWRGIGQSYRNYAAGWARAFPEEKQLNVERAINDHVDRYFALPYPYARANPFTQEAARQCALGNPAACP